MTKGNSMTRKQTYGFAAIATAALSIAGPWSLVHAQQAAPAGAPPAGNNRGFPGQAGAAGMSPGTGGRGMPGMSGMNMMGGQMGMAPPQEFDPEMAELAEAEATLAAHADELLAEYASMDLSTAKDPSEVQKTFKAKLRVTLARQFDAQKQRRNLELTRIEERVEKLREQIKKRN